MFKMLSAQEMVFIVIYTRIILRRKKLQSLKEIKTLVL